MKFAPGKYIAIIAAVTLGDGKGRAEGYTVCTLQMVITRGACKGQSLTKRYFYQQDLPELMKIEFLTLGLMVQKPEDIAKVKADLIGKIVLFSIVENENRLKCYIDAYIGSDDPARYAPKATPREI